MVRLHENGRAAAQLLTNQGRNMAEIHQRRDFYALMSRRKSEVVHRVVRNGEGMKIDLADAEIFAGFDLLDAIAERRRPFSRFIVRKIGALADVRIASGGGNVNGTID